MVDRRTTCSTALAIACTVTASIPGAVAQTDLLCERGDAQVIDWRLCRTPLRPTTDLYCIGCADDEWSHAPARREFAADLGDDDVLLFFAYGMSRDLGDALDAAGWGQQWFTRANQAARRSHFALQPPSDAFSDPLHRGDLTGYLATVLPPEQVHRGARCRDCRFNLALGMIWGYRWSSLSGRIVADTGMDDLSRAPGYGFRYLYRASPRWRYVLQIGRDDEALDLLGEAQWRIRPDAYLSVTGGFAERASWRAPQSDVKLYFSFD